MTINEFREQFFALADQATSIAITSHISPDDDSIGSVLSVYSLLKEEYPNKSIRIIYSGAAVERYKSFYNFDKIEWVDDVGNHLEGIDMLIGLDASKFARYSKYPEKLQTGPVTVAIDHHSGTPDPFTLLFFETKYTANCEAIYRALFDGMQLKKEIAELLLLGILGDTGSFTHVSPQQYGVFEIAAKLVSVLDMPVDAFKARYMGIPLKIIPLLQTLVANTNYCTESNWPAVQYTYIPRTIVQEGSYTDDDISAASHIYIGQYLPKVEGYGWGFVVTPRADGTCRMSSRSLPGSVNVRDLSERLAGGGGHDGASGATFADSEPADAINKVLEFMKTNSPVIR